MAPSQSSPLHSALLDAAGTLHEPADSDARIVCLVPSITELICDLGLAGQLVGRTGFCIHPWETVRTIPKLGGTKDVRLDRIRDLTPTHAVVNVDENTREIAQQLAEFVPHIIVTHPLGPLDNRALYRLIGTIFHREAQAERLCQQLDQAIDHLRARRWPTQDVLYLIWRDPWMTVAPDTYIARMLSLVGWRTFPRQPADRYPAIELEECSGAVDRVLLSSEPYHFKNRHLCEVGAAVGGADVSLIDGEMISWYGSRAIQGLHYLAAYATERARPTTALRPRLARGPEPIRSPCIGICELDGDHCRGCWRTLDEIVGWLKCSPAERSAIISDLGRRAASRSGSKDSRNVSL